MPSSLPPLRTHPHLQGRSRRPPRLRTMGSAHSSHSSISTAADEDDDDPSTASASEPSAPLPPAQAPAPPASASKVLEQEPEVLPCRAADSPLSPQPSVTGTPRLLGHNIKVWDPCHVLLPPPSLHQHLPQQGRTEALLEVVVVSHGECAFAMRPDLVGGRWPAVALTARGERQARALSVFLRSRGSQLAAAWTSPLDRSRATAELVCRVSPSWPLLYNSTFALCLLIVLSLACNGPESNFKHLEYCILLVNALLCVPHCCSQTQFLR